MTEDEARRLTQKLYRVLDSRRPEIEELDKYHDGKQPLVYASKSWADFHRTRYQGFSDNWCGVVANAPTERLRVLDIRMGEDKDGARELFEAWQRNDGEEQSSQGFLQAIVARRSFVRVWGDPQTDEPTIDFLHPSQVLVKYDSTGRRRASAIYAWQDDSTEYAILYTPTDLWKWSRPSSYQVENKRTKAGVLVTGTAIDEVRGDGGWRPWQPSTDDVWPLPNPLGKVPIVELGNRPRLGREPVSDIAGTKAMQDAINLLWAYLFNAADHASMPARVVMGQEPPKIPILDDTGQKVGEKEVSLSELSQGRLLWLTGQNTKISQWEAARLDVFTDAIQVAVGHIAAQTRTPSHYLIAQSDNVPGSGYELAEAGLVSRVVEEQTFFGADLRSVFELVALALDKPDLALRARGGKILWHDPAIRNEAQMADAMQKKRAMGYPLRYILELEGKDQPEIDRIMAMVDEEQTDPYLARIDAKDAAAQGEVTNGGAAEPAPVG